MVLRVMLITHVMYVMCDVIIVVVMNDRQELFGVVM